jgi:hypothetical protein
VNSFKFIPAPNDLIVTPQSVVIQLIPELPTNIISFELIGLEIILFTYPTLNIIIKFIIKK